jgi:hypothetical protein
MFADALDEGQAPFVLGLRIHPPVGIEVGSSRLFTSVRGRAGLDTR